MHTYKPISFGFIVLCPERNIPGLRATNRSIRHYHSEKECPILCVTSSEADKNELKEMNLIVDTIKGGGTITGLMNKGLAKAPAEWNFIVFAGSYIRPKFVFKNLLYIEDEKDVLFPIVDFKYDFVDGSMNGMCFHKSIIKTVGQFAEGAGLEIAKLFWSLDALSHGVKFKGILGTRIT